MSEAIIIWTFILLVQQQGMVGGAGADKFACETARGDAIKELNDLGSQIISASDCAPITLKPYSKSKA